MSELSKNASPRTVPKKPKETRSRARVTTKPKAVQKTDSLIPKKARGPAVIPTKAASFPQQKHWKKRPLNSRGVKQQKLSKHYEPPEETPATDDESIVGSEAASSADDYHDSDTE